MAGVVDGSLLFHRDNLEPMNLDRVSVVNLCHKGMYACMHMYMRKIGAHEFGWSVCMDRVSVRFTVS